MGEQTASGEKEACSVLNELNLDLVGNSPFGEKLLLFSQEIRVEIQFWELSHKWIIKMVEVDKFPKRKSVRRDKPRIQERFWQVHSEALVE